MQQGMWPLVGVSRPLSHILSQPDSDRDEEQKFPRKSEEIYLSSGEEDKVRPWESHNQVPSSSTEVLDRIPVTSPPVVLTVRDTGVDFTIVLDNLIAMGMRHAKDNEDCTGGADADEQTKTEALAAAMQLWKALKDRIEYLESCHNLLLNGFSARDVTVTDTSYTTVDGDTVANGDIIKAASNASAGDGASAAAVAVANAVAGPSTAASPSAAAAKLLKGLGVATTQNAQVCGEAAADAAHPGGATALPTATTSATTSASAPVTAAAQLMRGLGFPSGPLVREEEPLTQIVTAEKPQTGEPEVRCIGQATMAVPKGQAVSTIVDETADDTVTFKDRKIFYQTTSYKAPPPSRSFQNVSNIEKIVDPNDYHLSITHTTVDLTDDSKERRMDSDYVPSARASSDSEVSVIEIFRSGSTSKYLYGHQMLSKGQASASVYRWMSGDNRKRPSPRGASVKARSKIRESLVSQQDQADSSYNGRTVRKDTPQVSPSIPINPSTPTILSNGVASASSFVPTNDLILTRPTQGQDEAALNSLMRHFESTAAAVAAQANFNQMGQNGFSGLRHRANLRSPQNPISTRRSLLRPVCPSSVPSSSRNSAYRPQYQTFRRWAGPEVNAPEGHLPEVNAQEVVTLLSSDSDIAII